MDVNKVFCLCRFLGTSWASGVKSDSKNQQITNTIKFLVHDCSPKMMTESHWFGFYNGYHNTAFLDLPRYQTPSPRSSQQ